MTYNPNIPQGPDLPSDSQPDINSNFLSLNQVFGEDHIPFGNLIEEATLATPCVLTSTNHRLTTADTVTVFNMEGITTGGVRQDWSINSTLFVVTVIDEDTFSLDGSNTTDEPPYIANSGDFTSAELPYGEHTKNFFPSPLLNPPNRNNPKSAYFTQNIDNLAQLFFQNDGTEDDVVQLSNLPISGRVIWRALDNSLLGKGFGFTTPWNIIVNFGQVFTLRGLAFTLNYAVPYTSQVFSFNISNGPNGSLNLERMENPIGESLNNTQFKIDYASDSLISVRSNVNFIAIGV